jgi:hypothetical protein
MKTNKRIELPKAKRLPAPRPVVQGELKGLGRPEVRGQKSEVGDQGKAGRDARAPTRPATAKELREVTRPALRMIAPGKWVTDPGRTAPEYVLSFVLPQADGSYDMRPMSGTLAKLDQPLLQALGMVEQIDTLYRLARAGFIEIVRFSPQVSYLNLESLYGHLARVAEDPEFWDEAKGNLREYRRALA